MSQTVIRGTQILNNTVQRQDLDVSTAGQAVVTKVVQGSGITLSSTGADSGTGDVTVSTATTFVTKTAAYTLTAADSGKYVICSGGSWTLTLPTPVAGLYYRLRNDMGISGTTGTITLSPTGGTIDGLASIPLLPQQECNLITDGTNWRTHGLKREVILGTQDITSSTANGVVLLPVGYRYFELNFECLQSITDNQNLNMLFSINGGSSWLNTGYYWALAYMTSATAWSALYNANQALAFIGPTMSSSGVQGISRVKIYPGAASPKAATWLGEAGGFNGPGSFYQRFVVNGAIGVTGPVNAVQYSLASGNIALSCLTVKGVV